MSNMSILPSCPCLYIFALFFISLAKRSVIMLGKMQLMQKLERKIKENENLHVTLEPMIELVKAEKNKLMVCVQSNA
jgi:hypothetical protein